MGSIFNKIRTIGLSNIHSLLDGIKGLNSIGEYEQYIRDLQKGRNQLDDQSAASRGRKNYLDQQIATAKAHCEAADEQITILLTDDDPSNDHLATPLQMQYDAAMQKITTAEEELQVINQTVAQFDQAVQRIDIKITEASAKVDALKSMEKSTKAKEKAANALKGIDFGEAPDMSGVESKMMQKAAVADNALNRNLDKVTGTIGGPTAAEAAAAANLAKRRAAIKAKQEGK